MIHPHDEDTAQFSHIHALDFRITDFDKQYVYHITNDFTLPDPAYFKETGDNYAYFPSQELDDLTTRMFGLPFSNFRDAELSWKNRRTYRNCYTYKRQINIYFDGTANDTTNSVIVEIKGSYFEAVKWYDAAIANICSTADELGAKCTNWHSFVDDRMKTLSFDTMLQHNIQHWFTSRCSPKLFTGRTEESARSVTFGADSSPVQLIIYESGKYRGFTVDYLRLEIHLRKEDAAAAYEQFRLGTPIHQITIDRIAAQVTYIRPTGVKNRAGNRVKKTEWWEKFTDGSQPFKLIKPKRTPTETAKLEATQRYIRQRLIDSDPKEVTSIFLETLRNECGGDVTGLVKAVEGYFEALKI